jgi:hypothetical protein
MTLFSLLRRKNLTRKPERPSRVLSRPFLEVLEERTLLSISYPDFTSISGLQLSGSARQAGSVLRLTDTGRNEAGSAWFTTKQSIQGDFESSFQFQLAEPYGDGFAFVIQNSGSAALGLAGGYLGFSGISDSLAVEFDTQQNIGSPWTDPSDNHVSVQTRGTLPNSADPQYSLGDTSQIPIMKDGNVHDVSITYIGGVLRVYMDDSTTARLTVPVDLGACPNNGRLCSV